VGSDRVWAKTSKEGPNSRALVRLPRDGSQGRDGLTSEVERVAWTKGVALADLGRLFAKESIAFLLLELASDKRSEGAFWRMGGEAKALELLGDDRLEGGEVVGWRGPFEEADSTLFVPTSSRRRDECG
jgi:hypothetical protein